MRQYPKAVPNYPTSTYITGVDISREVYHTAIGDMWPLTWGYDDNIYAAAGDNRGSPMNIWRIWGLPERDVRGHSHDWTSDIINDFPLDPLELFSKHPVPGANLTRGIKPSGLLDIDGTLFMAVETMNYGEDNDFTRRKNLTGFIISSYDYGKTWNKELTPIDFFTGRLASCHFLQFGAGYRNSRDEYVYAYFPGADDGCSYWRNGDYALLGRVLLDCEAYGKTTQDIVRNKYDMLIREAWEFYAGMDSSGTPIWDHDDTRAQPVFRYEGMTGENHVSYNSGIGRYIMGNYSFIDESLNPSPYHNMEQKDDIRSQLTLFEASEPWGPWSLFYRDDNWGAIAGYQPSFPTKWMYDEGKRIYMVYSGIADDYNFSVQKLILTIDETKR